MQPNDSHLGRLGFDFGAEGGEELGEPGVKRRPSGTGDEVAVDYGIGHGTADVFAAGKSDIRTGSRIGTAFFPFQNSCDGEKLWRVTNRGNGFSGFREMVDELNDSGIEAKVFRRAATGDHQRVVIFRLHYIEGGVEREIVATFFGVGLIAFEVVDAGRDKLTGLFAWANDVDGVADHLKRFERDHHFIVFDIIADKHEDRLSGHEPLPEPIGCMQSGRRSSEYKFSIWSKRIGAAPSPVF